MSINLTMEFAHPEAVSNQVRYARIDNIVTPSFVNVSPNPIVSPATVAINIPNGQYRLESTPVYADGRTCSPTVVVTPACPGLISLNAIINSGNLIVTYLAPFEVPKVRITVNYPNGGSFTANYVNDGNNIVIPLPSGVTGDFSVSGQSVCDEDSGFYSTSSSQVVIPVSSSNVSIVNNTGGITISVVSGISGFTLSKLITSGDSDSGSHGAFFGSITNTYTGTPSGNSSANLVVNGVIIQCQNVPNTNGGTVTFSAASIAASDVLLVQFLSGFCPNGIPDFYNFGANELAACAAVPELLYTAFPFQPGVVMFTDEALTAPLTGALIIGFGGNLYNINSGTGHVGSPTGNSC